MTDEPKDLDTLWARYMGGHTSPMDYRREVYNRGEIHRLLQAVEADLTSMYLDTGEMTGDEIKRVASEIWQALEAEKARIGAFERRAEKLMRRGR